MWSLCSAWTFQAGFSHVFEEPPNVTPWDKSSVSAKILSNSEQVCQSAFGSLNFLGHSTFNWHALSFVLKRPESLLCNHPYGLLNRHILFFSAVTKNSGLLELYFWQFIFSAFNFLQEERAADCSGLVLLRATREDILKRPLAATISFHLFDLI